MNMNNNGVEDNTLSIVNGNNQSVNTRVGNDVTMNFDSIPDYNKINFEKEKRKEEKEKRLEDLKRLQ